MVMIIMTMMTLIPKRTWEDNIRMDLRKRGWEAVARTHLALVAGPWEHGKEYLFTIKRREFLD
jgi:hypothetical protein